MKNVLSADQRCRPEDSGTLLSDITHKVHALTKKRGFNAAYLFPGCFPLIKKNSIYYTWKPGLFWVHSSNGKYEHIFCTYVFRSSIYKLNANKSIYLKLFLFD